MNRINNPPNILEYHRSIVQEIETLKHRVKHLVPHNLTVGEWKEAILRAVLRRHLPRNIRVGRGFIVTRERASTQIDILVLKPNKPVLFQDGDLFIVSPDVPGAIIEVKSEIKGSREWEDVINKLAKNGEMSYNVGADKPWLGVFSYGSDDDQQNKQQIKNALEATYRLFVKTGIAINCITVGNDYFIRFWNKGEGEEGDTSREREKARFRAYKMEGLSPSYFVGNLVDAMCNVDKRETGYIWFAYAQGKRRGGELIEEKVALSQEPTHAPP